MVDFIEIIITSGILKQVEAVINYKNKVCWLNGKNHNVDDSFLNEIVKILTYWEKEYGTKEGLDLEEFTISVYSKNQHTTFHGKGIFPDNYSNFKNLLEQIKDK